MTSDKLKELDAKATPGPWVRSNDPKKWVSSLAPVTSQDWRDNVEADAALIVALRNDALRIITQQEAEIERLKAANGILEDGLQEVGDDYPGSSCQEWCQHQIKQARAALKEQPHD